MFSLFQCRSLNKCRPWSISEVFSRTRFAKQIAIYHIALFHIEETFGSKVWHNDVNLLQLQYWRCFCIDWQIICTLAAFHLSSRCMKCYVFSGMGKMRFYLGLLWSDSSLSDSFVEPSFDRKELGWTSRSYLLILSALVLWKWKSNVFVYRSDLTLRLLVFLSTSNFSKFKIFIHIKQIFIDKRKWNLREIKVIVGTSMHPWW